MLKFNGMYGEKPNFFAAACDSMTQAANSINIESDIQAWVAENKTGVSVPPEIGYMSYDSDVPSSPKPPRPISSNPSSANLNASSSSSGKSKPPPVGKYKAPTSQDILSSRVCYLPNCHS